MNHTLGSDNNLILFGVFGSSFFPIKLIDLDSHPCNHPVDRIMSIRLSVEQNVPRAPGYPQRLYVGHREVVCLWETLGWGGGGDL